jgi:hypothetical protein
MLKRLLLLDELLMAMPHRLTIHRLVIMSADARIHAAQRYNSLVKEFNANKYWWMKSRKLLPEE